MPRSLIVAFACFAGSTALARPADNTAPAAVGDLAVAATPHGGIALTWTAVGDDGGGPGQCSGAGRAAAYDLRYSTVAPGANPVTWFNGATQAAGEPAPLACGSAEGQCVPGLAPGATYYLALRVRDEANNLSGVSNIVVATAGAAAGVMHVDSVISSWFYAGGVKKRGQAFVVVLDALGQPVPCATVSAQWSGCYADVASGVTDHTGRARILSNRTASCSNGNCCFSVAVTDVVHSGFSYNAGANVATTGAANCNPFGAGVCPESAAAGCPADCDGSGTLDHADFRCFQMRFTSGDHHADCNGDGAITVTDFGCFQTALVLGCP